MKKLILIFAVLLATSVAFAQNVPPAIFYSDLTSGPTTGGQNNAGAFVTIHGNGFGASQGSSTVTIGGGAAASYQSWSNTSVTFQLGSAAKTGSIAISVGGVASNSVPFTVRSGKVYFVSTSGSDSNAGSYTAPWKTLAHAASTMPAGSITYVENGYTQSTELVLSRSGSASAPLAILGYPASSVTIGATAGLPTGVSITGSNWVLANLIFRGTQTAVSTGNVTGIRLAGSDISCPNATSTGACIATSGGSSFAILGNSIHNNGLATSTNLASYQAVNLTNTNSVEIGWNLITNTLGCNAVNAQSTSGLQYSYAVHDNYIYETPCEAIALGTVNPALGAVTVYNNIIQSSGTGPAPAGTSQGNGYAAIAIGGGSSTPAQVYNNTIYDAGTLGGESAGAVRALGAVNLTNNIFYLLGSEQYVSLDTTLSYLTGTNNLFYGAGSPLGVFADSVAGDPLFVNLAANNFHLSAGSPAIDSGATVQLATDYDGVPRPQGPAYDIGAYEYPEASASLAVSVSATPASTMAKGGTHSSKTPAVSLSPTSLSFTGQTVATTSAAQTITLKNTGTAALTISSIAASSSFAETNTCGTSLATSASCTISVTFTPTAAGTVTGTLSFTDNAAASPQSVSLSGSTATTLAITTTSLPSGVVGTAYSTTLAATGGTAPYTWTDPSCSGSCNTGMGFSTAGVLAGTPANAGTSTFTMTVTDSAGHTASAQLPITITAGTTTPAVSLSATSLTFASQTVATTSAAQTITLKNTGAGALSISSIAASGNFAETNTCGASLAASASCTVSVTFTPTAAGTLTGAITFTDNAAASPQAVSLSGTGASTTPTVSLSPTSLTFASQTVGTTSAAQTVTLTNTGAGALSISSIAASGNFAETNTCGTSLAASASCTVSVTFTPTAAGTLTGAITFTDNAAASPQAVLLSGTGATALAITTTSLPSGTVGTAYSTTLAAINGTAPYTWTDPSCSGACNTGMSFTTAGVFSGTPANAGTSTFTFTVTDSAGHTASTQLSITIAAAATPAVSLSPTSLTFASQTVGTTSAAQTVTLTNTGAGALSISGIAASGSFAETTACPSSLPAGASCTISVTFTPTAAGTLTGALTVTDNAATSTQSVSLSGTAVAAATPAAPSVALSWTDSSTSISGYYVYRSTQSGTGYALVNSSPVATASYSDTTVSAGQTYYYVVTAVNASGVQSAYSAQVTAVVPAS